MRTAKDRLRIHRQQRTRKLRHLRAQLEQTTDRQQRKRLIAKILRVSRTAPVPAE